MLDKLLERVAERNPLVQCITNTVTVNDCANILLALGGSPIMADSEDEAEEIVSIASALVLNIGNLSREALAAMTVAGSHAKRLGKPVVLDPVGAGASRLRTDTANRLLREAGVTVVRGNSSEIKTLMGEGGATKGVDADASDIVTRENLKSTVRAVKALAARTGAVIASTGAIDIVADEDTAYVIGNGHPWLCRITGAGCMLSALVGAFVGANPDRQLEATAAAVIAMGLCGELAYEKTAAKGGGTATFRTELIDAVSRLDGETLMKGAKYERHQ